MSDQAVDADDALAVRETLPTEAAENSSIKPRTFRERIAAERRPREGQEITV